jgi:tetratricopeptide (TPR) repeat protein
MPKDNGDKGPAILLSDDSRFRPIMQLINDARYSQALSQLDDLLPELNTEECLVADYWKIRCLTSMGRWQQARELVEETLTHVPPDNPLKICLELESASLLGAEQRPGEAANEIRAILARYADRLSSSDLFWMYVQAKTDLGNCLVNAGCYSEAIDELEEALSFEDQALSRYYIQFWLGIAYHMVGKLSEARHHLESAVAEGKAAPPNAELIQLYAARIRYESALIAYDERRFDDVLRQAALALEVGRQDPKVLSAVNRLRIAVEKVSVFLAEDPRFRPILQLIGDARYPEALSQLNALLPELNTEERHVADYWKIRCLRAMGKWQQARELVDEALTHVPPDNPLKICLELESADLLGAEQRPGEAAHEIRAILARYADQFSSGDLFWTYAQAKASLGNHLVNAGCYSEAIDELEEALSLENQALPRYYIHGWLGIAYRNVGRLSEARNHLEDAIVEGEVAPKAGLMPYFAARIRYELALIAYDERRFDDVLRQASLALEVGLQDPKLLRAVNRLRALVARASAS